MHNIMEMYSHMTTVCIELLYVQYDASAHPAIIIIIMRNISGASTTGLPYMYTGVYVPGRPIHMCIRLIL